MKRENHHSRVSYVSVNIRKELPLLNSHLKWDEEPVPVSPPYLQPCYFICGFDQIGVVSASYHFEKILTGNFYFLLAKATVGWFFAALKEEVLARGYFMAHLNRFSIPKMIVISSLLFMALHFIMGDFDPFKAASWILGGLVYGYMYVKSGSLTVATIVHAAHNHINDLVIHGKDSALVFLASKLPTSDKILYEFALSLLLLALTYAIYGKNGFFTPAANLKQLWANKGEMTHKNF